MLRAQVNGRNEITTCGRIGLEAIQNNLVRGDKRYFAYRVGEHKPEHRYQKYDNAREWLATLDGRGYLTIDGVQVMRNWKGV